ncbi:MAG: hypothetical protein ABIR32_11300 [Ilumatobacteraceae bacterium]
MPAATVAASTASTTTAIAPYDTLGTVSPSTAGVDAPQTNASGADLADTYLGDTTEIYRRTLANGRDLVVRRSNGTYATVFGFSWTAPTGSAAECLGDHAVFLGVPGDIGPSGSAWTASTWFDEIANDAPVLVETSMSAGPSAPGDQYLLLRVDAATDLVVLASADGTVIDNAPAVDGISAVVLDQKAADNPDGWSGLTLTATTAAGQQSAATPITYVNWPVSEACGPGAAPKRPLPSPGQQPAGRTEAERQIRTRHALLVDQTLSADEKPADLLDDRTGIDDAVARLHVGQYAAAAASATYAIDELVFTQPDEAWFRYTITSANGTFDNRFGIAVFDGTAWQITRPTLCQDLALAAAPCEPNPPIIEPPVTPEWEAAMQDWYSRANQYAGNDGCPPLSQC